MFPFAIACMGMIASIIGSFFVKGGDSTESHALEPRTPHGTNVNGTHRAGERRCRLLVVLRQWVLRQSDRVGDLGDRRPDRRVGARQVRRVLHERSVRPREEDRQAGRDGPATNILGGISTGMVSVALSVVLILAGVGVAYWGGQITFAAEYATSAGSTASPWRPSACSPPPAWSWRSTPTGRSPTTPAASPRWPHSTRGPRDDRRLDSRATPPRRSPRVSPSARRRSPPWPSSELRVRDCRRRPVAVLDLNVGKVECSSACSSALSCPSSSPP